MIEFKNVFIKYVDDFYSLYDFSCEIHSHTLFVGDFYDGTTALMRTVSKIDKHYSGEIILDNVDLKNIKDKDLPVAYLPEQPTFFENKNIFKNLYYPLKIRKIKKNIAKNLIYSIFLELKNNNFNIFCKFLNDKKFNNDTDLIDNILNLKVKKLNLSEKKIIALIRAFLRKPKYILLENLNVEHIQCAKFLLNKLKNSSTIIACENSENSNFEDFNIIKLNNEKKED